MRIKILILITISLFLFISPVYAESCDSEDIARLKNLAEHVDIAYTIEETTSSYKDNYTLSISNVESELEIVLVNDYNEEYTLRYDGKNNGKIKSTNLGPGNIKVNIYSINCDTTLKSTSIFLPYYNKYYDSECKEYKDKINVCKKWLKAEITQNDVKNGISEYKKEIKRNQNGNVFEKTIEKYKEYIIISGIILMVLIVSVIIINKKKSKLD